MPYFSYPVLNSLLSVSGDAQGLSVIGRIQFVKSHMSSLIGPSACARKPRKLETSHDRRRPRRVEKVSRAVIGREEVPAAAHTAAPYGVPLKSFFRFSENRFSDVS